MWTRSVHGSEVWTRSVHGGSGGSGVDEVRSRLGGCGRGLSTGGSAGPGVWTRSVHGSGRVDEVCPRRLWVRGVWTRSVHRSGGVDEVCPRKSGGSGGVDEVSSRGLGVDEVCPRMGLRWSSGVGHGLFTGSGLYR